MQAKNKKETFEGLTLFTETKTERYNVGYSQKTIVFHLYNQQRRAVFTWENNKTSNELWLDFKNFMIFQCQNTHPNIREINIVHIDGTNRKKIDKAAKFDYQWNLNKNCFQIEIQPL